SGFGPIQGQDAPPPCLLVQAPIETGWRAMPDVSQRESFATPSGPSWDIRVGAGFEPARRKGFATRPAGRRSKRVGRRRSWAWSPGSGIASDAPRRIRVTGYGQADDRRRARDVEGARGAFNALNWRVVLAASYD